MSVLPSSATYLASALRNGFAEHESFQKFYQCWIVEQDLNLQDLHVAARSNTTNDQQSGLINRVVRHYADYYRAKSLWVKHDVVQMLTPSWRSSLEDAFLWIGGWRPTMALHLLYSKSGLKMESRIDALIRGVVDNNSSTDLGDLSPSQLVVIDELQRRTVREERDITEEMAKRQESVADASMVQLSGEGGGVESERVESVLEEKTEGLAEVTERADDLRLRTLKRVIEELSPIQTVHFLIAAAELHLRLHEWGEKRDAEHLESHA